MHTRFNWLLGSFELKECAHETWLPWRIWKVMFVSESGKCGVLVQLITAAFRLRCGSDD